MLNDTNNKGAAKKPDITVCEQIIASSVGALATSLMVTPMDVVKIRLQQQVHRLVQGECFLYSNGLMDHLCTNCENPIKPLSKCEWYNRPGNFNGTLVSTYDAFVKITRHEGIRSLWSGLSPTMLSAVPATVFYFTIYDNVLFSLRERLGDRLYVPLLSGTIARTVAVTVVSPLELIRTKMQSQRHTYKELKKAIVRTVYNDGYRSLWRGLAATLMRDIPFSAFYWTSYEYVKRMSITLMGKQHTNFIVSFLCGAFSGTIAAVITMPFDVIKTHQQITLGQTVKSSRALNKNDGLKMRKTPLSNASRSGETTWGVTRRLVAVGGVPSLFSGLVPRVARVAPACAIMIGSYEYLKLFFCEKNAAREIVS